MEAVDEVNMPLQGLDDNYSEITDNQGIITERMGMLASVGAVLLWRIRV